MRQNTRSYYFAALEALDSEMGRLLNSLAPEVRANTVVIFIGDNGSHDTVSQGFDPEKTKFTVYEGGIHVPMIIAGDGVTQMGAREDALINITDLFATIAEMAGVDEVSQPDSVSFMDALTNPSFVGRKYAYSEFRFDDGSTAWTARNFQYKMIVYSDGRRELYDLSLDPFESTDLIASGVSEEMAAIIAELENYRNGLQP
jgi:arylsulfatase A-like enzyme